MERSNINKTATRLGLAGLLLILASIPALWLTVTTAGSLALAEVIERQAVCESRLSTLARAEKGTLVTQPTFLQLTLPVADPSAMQMPLAQMQTSLLYCNDFTLTQFCTGRDCSTPGITLTLTR